jgi:hypothetical protein
VYVGHIESTLASYSYRRTLSAFFRSDDAVKNEKSISPSHIDYYRRRHIMIGSNNKNCHDEVTVNDSNASTVSN